MTCSQAKDVGVVCSCNQGKSGPVEFTVKLGDGSTKIVKSEQEARTLVRMSGGSYTRSK